MELADGTDGPVASIDDARVTHAIREVLAGQRRGPRTALLFAGPAVVASIAYMDPGNFATNIQAGAGYGVALVWVVLVANAVAMLFQALSARIGLVTGESLPALCRAHFGRRTVLGMWAVSEIAAMATDLAEFLGGAIGLSLLLRLPLLDGMVVTGIVTYALLVAAGRGFRRVELGIAAFVAAIGACYLLELVIAPPDWADVAARTLRPRLPDANAVTLAVGIVGATVMPHAIYLQSGLAGARPRARNEAERRMLLRFSNRETVIALTLAGAINVAMVLMASRFHAGHSDVADIEGAYRTLAPLLGSAAAGIFLLSLMLSGISSSVVGTMAGQLIMQGFAGFRIPVALRRVITMVPAFVVVACGADATRSLVLSQVVLSLALPVPMVTLLLIARRRDIMGAHALGPAVMVASCVATALVLALNAALLAQIAGIAIPGIG